MGPRPGTLIPDPQLGLPAWTGPWQGWLQAAIEREISRTKVRYELSLDEFRGLYVSDEQVHRLVGAREIDGAGEEPPAPPVDPAGDADSPIDRIGAVLDLGPAELGALFVAFAPELDRKYDTLYAYLNDDVTRRHATIDLCRRLAGAGAAELDVAGPLFARDLLEPCQAPGSSWRSAAVTVREPARRYLFGELRTPARAVAGAASDADVARAAVALEQAGVPCLVLADVPAGEGGDVTATVAAACGRPLVAAPPATTGWCRDALLTARLHRALLHVACTEGDPPDPSIRVVVRDAAEAGVPLLLSVPPARSWRALVDGVDHEVVTLAPPPAPARRALWRRELAAAGAAASDDDVATVASLFSLHPNEIRRAARRATRAGGANIGRPDLAAAARRQGTAVLDELAVRVPLLHDWNDLVLPPPTQRRLRELASAIQHRHEVFDDSSLLRAAGGSTSLRAMFSGASGTGKTMSAAVVARDVGLDVFRIDLSAVVSKYIGETEKNLEALFTAAAGSNAILFFDEADALFGKRSEVRDAHDRYANIEVAYLLQRMETYDGVMILATNLAHHLDEAFSRRIHVEVEFPVPEEAQRRQLWRVLLPGAAPTSTDLDVEFLARQFPLTGGDIGSIALAAALLAAHEGGPITMSHAVRAVGRHRRKQGKLPTAGEFRQHLALVHGDGA